MKNIFLTWLLSRNKFSESTAKNPKNQSGFTLIEVLVVAVMIGILSAIAAPGWVSFANNQRTRTAQSRVFSALREAQSLARTKKTGYQVSFRNNNGQRQYAIHITPKIPPLLVIDQAYWDSLNWQDLESGVKLSVTDGVNLETTASEPIYSYQFNYSGNMEPSFTNRYTKIEPISGGSKYCVNVSTILGAIKTFNQDEGQCKDVPSDLIY